MQGGADDEKSARWLVQIRNFYTQLSTLFTELRVDSEMRCLDCSNSIGAQVGSPPTPPVSSPFRDDSQILVIYNLLRFSSRHTLAVTVMKTEVHQLTLILCYIVEMAALAYR
jgi:hypothetical protein